MIRIVAVGKKHEPWVMEGIERYHKRLKKPFDAEWVLIPHSAKQGQETRENESEAIFSRLEGADYVVLLDERGELLDSPAVSTRLVAKLEQSQRVVIVIGGAYGVSENVRNRANLVWSLSPLVFPHQLVRLVLTEQLYRTQEIFHQRPYHHE